MSQLRYLHHEPHESLGAGLVGGELCECRLVVNGQQQRLQPVLADLVVCKQP